MDWKNMSERSPQVSPLSSVSVEQERDAYREKLDHMKLLVKHYQQELQSYKIRKEGVGTVSKLLQEARQENMVLQKKNRTLESAVSNLQSRLAANGLQSTVTLDEGELFVPGTSKQLLDNLTRENARLRALVRNAVVDPEEVQRLQQMLQDQQAIIEQQRIGHEQDEKRISELDDLLRASDSEKDVQISQLRDELQKMKQNYQTQDILCHSLSEEMTILRQQLRDLAVRCQQMDIRLGETQKENTSANKGMSETHPDELELIRAEKEKLDAKVTELTEMNQRWQAYSTQRENSMQQMQHTQRELQDKLAKAQTTSQGSVDKEALSRSLQEARNKITRLEAEKSQLQQELQQTHENMIEQSENIERLQGQQQRGDNSSESDRDQLETIEALKAQIQICTEDFESERRDREKAQTKIAELERELSESRKEMVVGQRKQVIAQPTYLPQQEQFYQYNIPPQGTNNYNESLAARGVNYQPRYHIGEGGNLMMDGEKESSVQSKELSPLRTPEYAGLTDSRHGDTTVSLPHAPLLSVPSLSEVPENPISLQNIAENQVLECPKCHKQYTSDKHSELLEHIEICCE